MLPIHFHCIYICSLQVRLILKSTILTFSLCSLFLFMDNLLTLAIGFNSLCIVTALLFNWSKDIRFILTFYDGRIMGHHVYLFHGSYLCHWFIHWITFELFSILFQLHFCIFLFVAPREMTANFLKS